VGDHDLYVQCAGAGTPTIVFSNGAGSNHHEWDPIFETLARQTRSCRYDLPNTGSSERIDRVRTVVDDVADLHELERNGILEPPYVFVAFSAGSFVARRFASQHPDQVAGLVLVDPLMPGYERAYQELLPEHNRPARAEERRGNNVERYDYAASEDLLGEPSGLGPFPVVVIANDRHIRWETCDFCDPLIPVSQRLIDAFVAALPNGRVTMVSSPHWITGSHSDLVRNEVHAIVMAAR